MLEASIEPLALEGGVVVVTQGGVVEGAAVEPNAAAGGKAQASLAPGLVPVVHQMWEAASVGAYNEVLGGELQPEVELLQGVEARWAEEPVSEEEEEELMEEGQGALQPGGRAPACAVIRKRVEREEQCGGIKRRGHLSGAGQAGVKRRRQRQPKSAQEQAGGEWYLKVALSQWLVNTQWVQWSHRYG